MSESLYALGGTILGLILAGVFKLFHDRTSQKRLYDHRLRLEKEYERYCDLWDKLFELRRCVGQMTDSLSTNNVEWQGAFISQLFNQFQDAVRKGEPFMSQSVYEPCRDIVRLARGVNENARRQDDLQVRRREGLDLRSDEKITDEQSRLDEEIRAASEELDRLFQDVSKAIRDRVTP
jgi:hypothetical protein